MAAYTIDVRPRARRSIRQFDPSVRQAIAQVIDGLATDPRPPGFQPLTGHRPYLRVRSGDYRVVYTVDDNARVVTVAAVGTVPRSTEGSACNRRALLISCAGGLRIC